MDLYTLRRALVPLFCFLRSVYAMDLIIGWISRGFVYAMDFTWVFLWDFFALHRVSLWLRMILACPFPTV